MVIYRMNDELTPVIVPQFNYVTWYSWTRDKLQGSIENNTPDLVDVVGWLWWELPTQDGEGASQILKISNNVWLQQYFSTHEQYISKRIKIIRYIKLVNYKSKDKTNWSRIKIKKLTEKSMWWGGTPIIWAPTLPAHGTGPRPK